MIAQGIGFANCGRLYGAPAPLSGEAPSSWVRRLSLKYAWSPLTMAKFLGWSGGSYRDLDFSGSPPDVERLKLITLKDAQEFEAAFQIGRRVLSQPKYRCLIYGSGDIIQHFCPHCLREDETPFFRTDWRLACTVICSRHRTLLRNSCPHCGARVLYGRKDRQELTKEARQTHLRKCAICRGDLSVVDGVAVSVELTARLLEFQSLLWQSLLSGGCSLPRYGFLSVHELLEIFLIKTTLIRRSGGRPPIPIKDGYGAIDWDLALGVLAEEIRLLGLGIVNLKPRLNFSNRSEYFDTEPGGLWRPEMDVSSLSMGPVLNFV